MKLNTSTSRTILSLTGLALTLGFAPTALAAPPPHAPAHGYRNKKATPPPKRTPSKRATPRTANDLDGDGIPNSRDRDMDGDGVANTRDRDMDGDGIPNSRDRHPQIANRNQKPLPKGAIAGHPVWNKMKRASGDDRNTKQHTRKGDIDKDGISNRKDKDLDGDGIRNKNDKDRDGDKVANKKDDFDRRKNRK